MSVAVANFYLFVQISPERLTAIHAHLDRWAERTGARGLVVMAEEGINATLSGDKAIVEEGIQIIEREGGFVLEPKWSEAERQPFNRWKVDVRKEIVTFGFSCVEKRSSAESFLTPAQWHARLSDTSRPKPILIDTRNIYETEIGTFEGAIDPRLETFTDILPYLDQHPELKEQELLIFCTGGIRCEKATPYLESHGYKNVKQLHGGILKYLEQFPNGHFKGECFVFDHRVAVDQKLAPTQHYWLCALCGDPGDKIVTCRNCGHEGKVCSRCMEHCACSKNCRYHLGRANPTSPSSSFFKPIQP